MTQESISAMLRRTAIAYTDRKIAEYVNRLEAIALAAQAVAEDGEFEKLPGSIELKEALSDWEKAG